ncbi:uncharacterized protein N7511_003862 [Penicillium nucicola]|uniref:uncharacterized protein n=1 Tax=Penicillium nucicola TaxID=1850975 RepID=UPI0025454616|nr:uncharacterized protein N7511_003862 [Penicillium nucicola]KAJ5766246.1 hypothetical protein N7511_003862 [Penicillium nucicola]
MRPSASNISEFMSCVPGIDEARAGLFVEVCIANADLEIQFTDLVEYANSINEAVDQYYENPNRHSNRLNRPPSSIVSPMAGSPSGWDQPNSSGSNMSSTRPPSYSLATRPMSSSHGSETSRRVSSQTTSSCASHRSHENALMRAAKVRAQDEAEMQKMLHSAQLACRVYNPEIEPEHETHLLCECHVHKYWKRRLDRLDVLEMWSKAVLYPGEKPYHDFAHLRLSNNNPYCNILSSYALAGSCMFGVARPEPQLHANFIQQTAALDASLNEKAQIAIQLLEPSFNIWELEQLESLVSNMSLPNRISANGDVATEKSSKRSSFRKALSVRSSDERTAIKIKKRLAGSFDLRSEILKEEEGRWQEQIDRKIVSTYQEYIGIAQAVSDLRTKRPIQYLSLLRAGYLEPISVAWQSQACNPLRFTIDASAGWRGVTPTWRGYKDTAEERTYWVRNHRVGGQIAAKPNLISELKLAWERMDSALESAPRYQSPDDICRNQYPREGYSKQINAPFETTDNIRSSTDETMILLDVRGAMDFNPLIPKYNQYLITGFFKANQPKNKDLALAIVRRFIEALGIHDSNTQGYPLVTFSSQANYINVINGRNLEQACQAIKFTGPSRIMVGWQKIKEMHFQKHSETATFHPIYGWQAGPQTPKLRLILMLGGEVNDIDEFELNILDATWAHITILLMGADGCPHHHRFASRLRRMADSYPHMSFVETQGLVPERMITHELLKHHLDRDLSMPEFENLEQQIAELPPQFEAGPWTAQSGRAQLEELLIELPGQEEPRVWQREQDLPHSPDLHELPNDPRPVELPANNNSANVQQPPRPSRPPPSPPQSEDIFDPPPPYLATEEN